MNRKLPFNLSKEQSFYEALSDWIGDVFYDILPEKNFELRDEQIYMAFQLLKAYKDKKVIFAEAGVGTGKTIVYLLYALSYARYTGKPAIIACADETLIEQIVKKQGDIHKLEQALDLSIDVRLAKSREQYLCLQKLEQNMFHEDDYGQIWEELPDFVHEKTSMKKFHHYGDRKEYPHISDESWEKIGWDSLQDCLSCQYRHRCGQTLHREHYREAVDLIVCSHDFYMEHIWTKDSRKREGQLPLLPEASSVVFDEGHLLEFASQKALTYKIRLETLNELLDRLSAANIREETLYTIEDIIVTNEKWFEFLEQSANASQHAERLFIERTKDVVQTGKALISHIEKLLDELVFESEMYVIEEYLLKIVEEYLEQIMYALKLFVDDQKGIHWLEGNGKDKTFVVMPRLVEEVLKTNVFSQKIPFIFSSATLSYKGDFTYVSKSLGIESFEHFTVESPYEYDELMNVYLAQNLNENTKKNEYTMNRIHEMEGKTLVLFPSKYEMEEFRSYVQNDSITTYPFLFEGDREISDMVAMFQEQESSILCSYHLWEGLDIPGSSLSQVIIYSLPFPPVDPVFDAKRQHAEDPVQEVDIPYMALRLRQGIGRLIRTSTDKGSIHILLNEKDLKYKDQFVDILPVDPKTV